MNPSSAQAFSQPAVIAYRTGKYDVAIRLYQQAASLYAEADDRCKQAEMLNDTSVVWLQAGNAQAALEAADGTDQVFADAGDVRSQALAIGNQAAALEGLNKLDESLSRYRVCAELLKQSGDEENRALVLKRISSLQIRTEHQLEALASMESALNQKKKLSFQERFLKKLLKIPMDMLNRGK